MKLRPLPEEVRALLKGAPPRLVNHLRLVHDTAYQLPPQLQRSFPELEFDRDLVLFGAATHDVGKMAHPEELSQPGTAHEEADRNLLRRAGFSEAQARFAVTHGRAGEQPLEDLLVRLADKLWKGQRDQPTEDALVQAASSELMLDRWDVDARVDGILTDLAAGADDRLAAQ